MTLALVAFYVAFVPLLWWGIPRLGAWADPRWERPAPHVPLPPRVAGIIEAPVGEAPGGVI